MLLLCGDIGGTKTLIQLVDVHANGTVVLAEKRYSSSSYTSFDLILENFLSEHKHANTISAVCFGVAGPVINSDSSQSASVTNLPWQMDSVAIAQHFKFEHVALINDFQAIGYGISALTSEDFVNLQTGESIKHGNQLVIGAGTGLGVTQMIWTGDEYQVIPTEGGHAEFAPADAQQLQLAEYLMQHKGRSSIEFVLSGPGLVNLYSFLSETNQQLDSDAYQNIMQSADPAAAIAQAADANQDSLAYQAMSMFVQAYGGQAGNFALSCLALGGVYIAGGIAAKILHHLQGGQFIDAFNAKGKMSQLMQRIPVNVITNQAVGLIGSRVYAEKLAKL